MRTGKLRAAVLLSLILLAVPSVSAQRTVKLSATPKAFRDLYTKFASTVRKGDVKLIATMTAYPFKYGFDAGDEGTWDRAAFIKNFGDVIMPQPLVFMDKNPEFTVSGSRYTLADQDNGSYYTFAKKGGAYKFISYIVEP